MNFTHRAHTHYKRATSDPAPSPMAKKSPFNLKRHIDEYMRRKKLNYITFNNRNNG